MRGKVSPKPEDPGKRVRETIQRTGNIRCDGLKNAPDDDYGDGDDADDELDQPPCDEDRAENYFEEGFHEDDTGERS